MSAGILISVPIVDCGVVVEFAIAGQGVHDATTQFVGRFAVGQSILYLFPIPNGESVFAGLIESNRHSTDLCLETLLVHLSPLGRLRLVALNVKPTIVEAECS